MATGPRIPGISWHGGRGKYQAYVRREGKQIHVGWFDDRVCAFIAFNEAMGSLYGGLWPLIGTRALRTFYAMRCGGPVTALEMAVADAGEDIVEALPVVRETTLDDMLSDIAGKDGER